MTNNVPTIDLASILNILASHAPSHISSSPLSSGYVPAPHDPRPQLDNVTTFRLNPEAQTFFLNSSILQQSRISPEAKDSLLLGQLPSSSHLGGANEQVRNQLRQLPAEELVRRIEVLCEQHRSSPQTQPTRDDQQPATQQTAQGAPFSASLEANQPAARTQRTDATTITKWSTGLKYVNKMTQDPKFAAAIEKMIADQAQHEKSWWEGRQELVRKQAAREEGTAKLNDVFRAVGATKGTVARASTVEENVVELAAYDKKVYRASREMANAMTAELRNMSVPFFCVNIDLVGRKEDHTSRRLKGVPEISEEELMQLKRRMLEYLTDLYSA